MTPGQNYPVCKTCATEQLKAHARKGHGSLLLHILWQTLNHSERDEAFYFAIGTKYAYKT